MKKIIIATDLWKPQVNGVVTATEKVFDFLSNNGFEVIVVHPGLFLKLPNIFPNDPSVKIPLPKSKEIISLIETEKPDYIHIVTEGPIGFTTRAICIKKKIKFTTAYHGNIPYYIEHYVKVRIKLVFKAVYDYYRWFHRPAAATMVSTQSLREELESRGFKNLVLSPLGVDVDFFKRKNIRNNSFVQPVFVYFGRIAKEKNIEEFLSCDLPGTKLIIGSGPLESKLKIQYKDAIFMGYKSKEDLVDLLSACDVFVFPSLTETFGLVILEALACGVPVAAHEVMGPKDIITQGVDGFLDADLKKAALACLNLSRDKCRHKALQFSWENAGKTFVKNLVPTSLPSK